MAELNGGSRNWPILGENEEDWAPFAYLWPNYVRMDHKNINNGTGNQAEKEVVRKANLHSILALATQNNSQAREIVESREEPADDGTFTDVTLKDMINKARLAYAQLKPTDSKGVRAFAARHVHGGRGNCNICGSRHAGECWYRNTTAFQAAWKRRGGEAGKTGKGKLTGKPKCYNCHKRGHIARDCPKKRKSDSESDDESELDEATLKKAAKQLKKQAGRGGVIIPGC